jgi:hypothetical protein
MTQAIGGCRAMGDRPFWAHPTRGACCRAGGQRGARDRFRLHPVLSVRYPHLCVWCQAHGPWLYNLVISTNRCERNHGYVKSRIRPMRGLNSFTCATRLFLLWTRCSWSSVTSCGRLSERRAPADAAMSGRAASPRSSLDSARPCRTGQRKADRTRLWLVPPDPTPMSENPRTN